VASALNTSLSGSTATTLKVEGTEIDVRISLNDTYEKSIENLKQILIPTATGQYIPVGQIADFEYDNSPSQINRQDQVRTITISSALSGRDLQSVSNDIRLALDRHPLPVGYTYEFTGTQQEMIETFTSLTQALLLSIVLIFMILASQFESLVQPFIIMMAVPFALTGAFLSLFIAGMPLSLPAFMGIIMLVGIVVNNSILLIDFINQNRTRYEDRNEAIVDAGRYRLRPIVMTMLTTCLGLAPIALATSDGSEIQAPMGVTVIGGLLLSTLITLVIVPVIYSILDDRGAKRRAKRVAKGKKEVILGLEE
jgi:HAE1 family hydrophobic/amphiphilic exporter-1